MPAREETSTRAQTDGRNPTAASSSDPSFLKVLHSIADAAPRQLRDTAHSLVGRLDLLYEEVQVGGVRALQPHEIINSAGTVSNITNMLNNICQSVGIPFYNEEWVYKYWIPMCRVSIPQVLPYTVIADEALKGIVNVFLKVDIPHLSSDCKTEVLRVLGEILEVPDLSVARANDVVNIVIKALFDERPYQAESRATRRATALVVVNSEIIGPFLKFLVDPPREDEKVDEEMVKARIEVKHDICYLLGLVLTSVLGELDPKVVKNNHPSFKAAIDRVSPKIWGELTRLGDGRIDILRDIFPPATPESLEIAVRLFAIFMCFECLVVLDNEEDKEVDKDRMFAIMDIACEMSRCANSDEPDPEAEVHVKSIKTAGWVSSQELPLTENARDWFAEMAGNIAGVIHNIVADNTQRSIVLNEGYGFLAGYPHNVTGNPRELPKEEAKQMIEAIYDDQKRRGLLNEDDKPAFSGEQANSTGAGLVTGTKCGNCSVDEVYGSNLKLMRCGGCKSVWYCSGVCQKTHWPKHKKFCKKKQAENKK
jgi:hypothetical protein